MKDEGARWTERQQGLTPPSLVRLSRGDVVNVMLPDGQEFNGDYTVGPDGKLSLPYLRGLRAAGLSEAGLERRIQDALVRKNLFSPDLARVAVRVVHYAAIRVRVQGAVFQPGSHTINEARGDRSEADIAVQSGRTYGSSTIRRTLTAALRVAAGVRPDADISQVELIRRGQRYVLDLRGVLTGEQVSDPVLEDGDSIRVPSRHCFQPELVRPSQITPRGIRIYISKIHFGPDSRYDEKMPYGLRLLQAAMIASCIGGTKPTRGHREIVLVSTNPVTRRTEVVQRSV
jgi:protein involved in polysaccharide export with SLBB domain